MAPKPPAPIPKALAGASVLVEVLINKYQYHLPLYRQSKMMESLHVTIADHTLGNWVMQSGLALMPLYDALWKAILESRYLPDYLLSKVHDLRRGLINPISLLPHTMDQAVLKKFADELLADAKKILDSL